jgi:radical SAM protein with 4Fe4S-binding SPASM domain
MIGKIDTIQVSIDGLNGVYEKIRKNASFKTLDDNLKSLSDLCRGTDTDLMLNMVVTEENFRQMPLLVQYAGEIGIKYMDFTLFNLVAVNKINRSYYGLYKSPEFLKVLLTLEEYIRNAKDVIVTNRNFKTENGFHKCPFPWTHFYITWNGFVTPCCAKPFPKELNFGNVFDGKLIRILNSYDFRKFREMWYKNETPDFCHKCHFIDIEHIKGYN